MWKNKRLKFILEHEMSEMTSDLKIQDLTKFKISSNAEKFERFKYLVLKTGYTSRLLNPEYKFDDFLAKQNKIFQIKVLLICGENLVFKDENLSLVKEFNSKYLIPSNSIIFYIDDAEMDNYDFFAWFDFARHFVSKVKYCANYGINGITREKDVLLISYETESG